MIPNQDERTRILSRNYDRHASVYEELWAPFLLGAGRRLLDLLTQTTLGPSPETPPTRIIDIGAGPGALLPWTCSMFPEAQVVGVDRSIGMLRRAPSSANSPGLHGVARMDARQLALADAAFDLALHVFMLFHVNPIEAGLAETRRVLRPGGRVATLTWGTHILSRADDVWASCLDEHGAPEVDPTSSNHDQVDTPEKVVQLLESCGFREARAHAEVRVHETTLENFFRLKTKLGRVRERFEALTPEARSSCLEQGRRRLAGLSPADFRTQSQVIYAGALRRD